MVHVVVGFVGVDGRLSETCILALFACSILHDVGLDVVLGLLELVFGAFDQLLGRARLLLGFK